MHQFGDSPRADAGGPRIADAVPAAGRLARRHAARRTSSRPSRAVHTSWATSSPAVAQAVIYARRAPGHAACIVFSERSFQSLPQEQQAVLREASAVERERMNEIGRHDDEQLLKAGLLRTQAVVPVPVSESFRSEFFAAARAARDRVADRFVRRDLLDRVLRMLVDYRTEHEQR